MRYQVYVGNIGCVYDGNSIKNANSVYSEYTKQSLEGYGQAANEDVSLYDKKYDETLKEFFAIWVCGKPIEIENQIPL